jgi:translation initiation factor 4G
MSFPPNRCLTQKPQSQKAEVYFTNLPNEHGFHLVEKLIASALESKDTEAQLVANFFDRAVTKDLCTPSSFDEGFLLVSEILDGIAIDAPKAFKFMAMTLKGVGVNKDEERRTRIVSKLETTEVLQTNILI